MNTVRDATPNDLKYLVSVGRRFHAATGWHHWGFHVDSLASVVGKLLQKRNGGILIGERSGGYAGTAAYVLLPFWLDQRQLIAQELWYWVEPRHRGGSIAHRLLKAMEASAREAGATTLTMLAEESLKPDLVARFLARQGYEPTERSFLKAL